MQVAKGSATLEDIREERRLLDIPSEIINTQRLTILMLLHTHGYLDFSDLKNSLRVTEGSLASHLKTLEKIGLVKGEKEFEDKKPKTIYHLSKEGDKKFAIYLDILKRMIKKYE